MVVTSVRSLTQKSTQQNLDTTAGAIQQLGAQQEEGQKPGTPASRQKELCNAYIKPEASSQVRTLLHMVLTQQCHEHCHRVWGIVTALN
jgi:hypothetical protein